MSKSDIISAAIIGLLVAGLAWLIAYAVQRGALNAVFEPEPTAPTALDAQPATKTRCDITGFMASSIIAEEAANGYRFNGRVSTFLCGDNGLSFSLETTNAH